jgi:Heterokaryon incompatibility protein (HET)
MKLINTHTLEIKSIADPVREEYAILSHTWDEDEVTYQDMSDIALAVGRKGFAKVQNTCLLAKANGIDYVWIDTCCIDKTSSAELSEAINSMFNWYKRATVCYAFLSDLPKNCHESDSPSMEDLKNCRWFTRGWTLQELIAPTEVLFLDEDWTLRCTKTGLNQQISSITFVDEEVLADSSKLWSISLAQRMSWASMRHTTREEDMAYCLLGIFDVNMPMIYGEGQKAFIRLQEEILKKTTDLSIFAWQTTDTRSLYRGLLARSPPEFRQCGDIILNTDQFRFRDEISITNRGIRINAILHHSKTWGGNYMMDLDCYRGERRSNARVSILLKRTTDGYVRVHPQRLASESPFNQRRTIYVKPDLGTTSKTIEDDHDYGISLSFLAGNKTNTVYSVEAVPNTFWDANELVFFTKGLTRFTGFVRFCVSPTMSTDLNQTPEEISKRDGLKVLVVCDLDEVEGLKAGVFGEPDLSPDAGMAAGFISPFRDLTRYGPQGDPESLAMLSSRVKGMPQVRLTTELKESNQEYEISVHCKKQSAHRYEIRVVIGSSVLDKVALEPPPTGTTIEDSVLGKARRNKNTVRSRWYKTFVNGRRNGESVAGADPNPTLMTLQPLDQPRPKTPPELIMSL